MQERQTSRDVSARAAVEAIRGTMSNNEVMERFKISPRGFADLLKQLFEKKLISEDDMVRRGIRFRIKKVQDEADPEPEPAPKPRITPAPTPRVMSSPRNAAQGDSEEEFLDTIALTKLFTTFGPSPQAKQEQAPGKTNEPAEEPKDESEESTDKKGKFSITGFFKRVR